jgi:hypothetical protein
VALMAGHDDYRFRSCSARASAKRGSRSVPPKPGDTPAMVLVGDPRHWQRCGRYALCLPAMFRRARTVDLTDGGLLRVNGVPSAFTPDRNFGEGSVRA